MAATAFLRQFADSTSGSSRQSLLIVVLWLAITLGRVIGLRDQLTLTLVRLYRHATVLCVGGAAAMLVLLVSSRSTVTLWITVTVFGLFTGPLLGYGYDLSTRVSPFPATSTAVAQFGITAGARYVRRDTVLFMSERAKCPGSPRKQPVHPSVYFIAACSDLTRQ